MTADNENTREQARFPVVFLLKVVCVLYLPTYLLYPACPRSCVFWFSLLLCGLSVDWLGVLSSLGVGLFAEMFVRFMSEHYCACERVIVLLNVDERVQSLIGERFLEVLGTCFVKLV